MPIISECAYEDFTLMLNEVVVQDYSSIGRANECAFELPVFAYPSDTTDKYRNDFTSTLMTLNNRYTNKEIYLEVKENGCNWTQVAQLNNSTYGTYYTFTSQPDWIGYKIDWYKVYNLEGVGCYRIRWNYDNLVSGDSEIRYSYTYNLKLYNDNLADKTTKIYYKINGGKIGDKESDLDVIDFKDIVWEREIRLPMSFFGFESSEYSREYVRYKNGAQVWTQDEQVETLLFNAKKLPYSLHRELKINALMSDEIKMSDYNLGNVNTYNNKRVVCTSNYEPKWNLYNTYASVELTFKPYYENNRRKRC